MKATKDRYDLIFSGGGTSGHINPAIAIAQRLCEVEPRANVIFCGTENGIEHEIVTRSGFEFHTIKASPFPRKISSELIKAALTFRAGRKMAEDLIDEIKPDVVVGTGGYVCGPVLGAAMSRGVPRLIHEQNAYPGKSNLYTSRGAEVICISYEQTRSFFTKAKKVVLTGNPVRSVFNHLDRETARKALGLGMDEKLVLATGGSLGARQINMGIIEYLEKRPDADFSILLACGKKLEEETRLRANQLKGDQLKIKPYIYDMQLYMAAADLIICRAGAITCAEVAALGRAAILIPYPYAAEDHQTKNARAFSDVGAAVHCPNSEFNGDWLVPVLDRYLNDDQTRAEMERKVKTFSRPEAVDDIVDEILGLMGLPPMER